MSEKKVKMSKGALPEDGAEITASPGNKFTRIHLDLADDGITLAMVGAASSLSNSNRHTVKLTPTEDGITLSMVGAASSK